MAGQAAYHEPEDSLEGRLTTALSSLEESLAQASRAVADIQEALPQIGRLAGLVADMEAAMARARQQLAMGADGARLATTSPPPLASVPVPQAPAESGPPVRTEPPASSPPLASVPIPEPPRAEAPPPAAPAEPTAAAPQGAPSPTPSIHRPETTAAPTPPAQAAPPEVPAAPATPETGQAVSRCLRLDVSIESGSLDLKAVDSSVSESPAVADVALLDYDGRHATLKAWIQPSADAEGVRAALLDSLHRNLADSGEAEVRVEFEPEA